MTIVPSHLYFIGGVEARREPAVLKRLMVKSSKFHDHGLTYIHSIQHLSKLICADENYLKSIILREISEYDHYSIPKKSGGSRFISAPHDELKKIQQWINFNVLKNLTPHPCCYSYHKKASIYKCAEIHCSSKWLLKLDIETFFDMTSEVHIYKQFTSIGYSPIVSFALSRICTYQPKKLTAHQKNWELHTRENRKEPFSRSGIRYIGRLPQGSPTSPMLSNMAFYNLDEKINLLVKSYGGLYSRYADDIFISFSSAEVNRTLISNLVGRLINYLKNEGYKLNKTKIKLSPPGSRKIVLGLNVDSETPTISREFKRCIDSHLYALAKHGPILHALEKKFQSVFGMLEHIKGKILFARSISREYGDKKLNDFYRALESHGFN
ncbi:TPA: RNA-directed DNA polymerase [Klebsiella variicola subsp. variicola]|uniref:reverse transcriptase family protein n=1 Tax=Klebsiella sp. JB_Kp016 TaxID=3153368 RepID=UPI002072F450|nr:reverse transcriptase family protein [Klebsiella pneumoniae]HCA9527218.1 RNA-directed DNA polymerase [Klebsiella variicola subsp. variicola]